MPTPSIGAESIWLNVADLPIALDARGTGIRMGVPAAYESFLASVAGGGLALSVRDEPLRRTEGWRPLYAPRETWQLWRDERGCYVFVTGRHSQPARQVTIEPGFVSGDVVGRFGNQASPVESLYPLQGIDLMIGANWLADTGDLVLHAAGVEVGGRGYAFAGSAGAGKSTLASAFVGISGNTVLGEDSLVLRYLEGRFWIYGTPWHLNPAMCSPRGAPLDKLFFLDRMAVDGVTPCAPVDGVAWLLQTAFVPYYRPEAMPAILNRLELLATRVPFYTLSYRLGSDPLPLILGA